MKCVLEQSALVRELDSSGKDWSDLLGRESFGGRVFLLGCREILEKWSHECDLVEERRLLRDTVTKWLVEGSIPG